MFVTDHAQRGAGNVLAAIQSVPVRLHQRVQVAVAQHTFLAQLFGIDRHGRRLPLDGGVHQRLRHRRLVRLIVTMTPVTAHIDDDVVMKFVAVVHR